MRSCIGTEGLEPNGAVALVAVELVGNLTGCQLLLCNLCSHRTTGCTVALYYIQIEYIAYGAVAIVTRYGVGTIAAYGVIRENQGVLNIEVVVRPAADTTAAVRCKALVAEDRAFHETVLDNRLTIAVVDAHDTTMSTVTIDCGVHDNCKFAVLDGALL